MTTPNYRSHYNRQREVADFSDQLDKTHQSFRDECDINKVLERWMRSGALEHVQKRVPTWGDFTGAVDFKTAHDAVHEASEAFMTLGSDVRAKFANNPAELLAFLRDESNREEAIELGLIEAPVEAASPQVPVSEAVLAPVSSDASTNPPESPPAPSTDSLV